METPAKGDQFHLRKRLRHEALDSFLPWKVFVMFGIEKGSEMNDSSKSFFHGDCENHTGSQSENHLLHDRKRVLC